MRAFLPACPPTACLPAVFCPCRGLPVPWSARDRALPFSGLPVPVPVPCPVVHLLPSSESCDGAVDESRSKRKGIKRKRTTFAGCLAAPVFSWPLDFKDAAAANVLASFFLSSSGEGYTSTCKSMPRLELTETKPVSDKKKTWNL